MGSWLGNGTRPGPGVACDMPAVSCGFVFPVAVVVCAAVVALLILCSVFLRSGLPASRFDGQNQNHEETQEVQAKVPRAARTKNCIMNGILTKSLDNHSLSTVFDSTIVQKWSKTNIGFK